jgi:hypothetical protein
VSGTLLSDYTVVTVAAGSQLTLGSQRTRPAADIDIRVQDGAGNVLPGVQPVMIPVEPVRAMSGMVIKNGHQTPSMTAAKAKHPAGPSPRKRPRSTTPQG